MHPCTATSVRDSTPNESCSDAVQCTMLTVSSVHLCVLTVFSCVCYTLSTVNICSSFCEASWTGMLNSHTLQWDEEMLSILHE
jgi:glycerol kinase